MLNQFLRNLKYDACDCISVYYPYGKGHKIISLLKETNRTNSLERIESEIEKKIASIKKNPSSIGNSIETICIFGWIKSGNVQLKHIGLSKKLPYIYMRSKNPFLKPLADILKTQQNISLVILDQKKAKIQKFHGNTLINESSMKINLHGRHKKGGQSQGRFMRARQTKIHVFYKKIAIKVREMCMDSELILLGGPGQAKTEFFDELDSELTMKCRFADTISFSTPVNDVFKNMLHHLYQHRRKHVKEIIARYEKLIKTGLTAKKNSVIYNALNLGAVDTLIVSANYHSNSQFKNIVKMLEIAKTTSSIIEFISSPNIIKKLDIDNSVLAILRYKIK